MVLALLQAQPFPHFFNGLARQFRVREKVRCCRHFVAWTRGVSYRNRKCRRPRRSNRPAVWSCIAACNNRRDTSQRSIVKCYGRYIIRIISGIAQGEVDYIHSVLNGTVNTSKYPAGIAASVRPKNAVSIDIRFGCNAHDSIFAGIAGSDGTRYVRSMIGPIRAPLSSTCGGLEGSFSQSSGVVS